MRKKFSVAVVGATGAVGQEMLKVLSERRFPVSTLRVFASPASARAGKTVRFRGRRHRLKALSLGCFRGVDVALFSAGASISDNWAPAAVADGALVVDNSSVFRMHPAVPLIVPELNARAMRRGARLFAVPNCSTIMLLMAAKPLHDAAGLKRVAVATYQAVSGAGAAAIRQLEDETRGWARGRRFGAGRIVLPHRIAFNLIPQVDRFLADGFSKEEQKFVDESRKILGLPNLQIVATTVRVPVWRTHSEAAFLEFERPISPERARRILAKAPGVKLLDEPQRGRYPMPLVASGRDEVFVGRIRRDPTVRHGLALFVAGDQLRIGAATTAVQIAELALRR